MRWHVFAIGRPKLDFARTGIAEYLRRLGAMAPLEITYLKNGSREEESTLLLERSEGQHRIALDERGEQVTSRGFAERIGRWEQDRVKSIAVLIGGADGHTPELRERADWLWSFSRMTMQHELALVILLEQIYRGYGIKAGTPYHRD